MIYGLLLLIVYFGKLLIFSMSNCILKVYLLFYCNVVSLYSLLLINISITLSGLVVNGKCIGKIVFEFYSFLLYLGMLIFKFPIDDYQYSVPIFPETCLGCGCILFYFQLLMYKIKVFNVTSCYIFFTLLLLLYIMVHVYMANYKCM